MKRVVLLMLVAASCGRKPEATPPTSVAVAPPEVVPPAQAVVEEKPAKQPASEPEPSARRAAVEEDLKTEEREANPNSESVTLILNITPPVKAVVMWGAKQMAKVTPDKPTVELQRPRASGPLDLEIRADGFLPHHTRLHSDRNDKVNVRLVREADAPGLFGYRSSSAATAVKAKK